MAFTSYAQNFEDVMLWRALKHVPNGRYIDVGAQHPFIDSVSKGFYEHGWRGIHFEPVPQYADLLRKDRPDEIVMQVALSDKDGVLELNVIPDTGLSTAVRGYAEDHQKLRGFAHHTIHVPMLPLRSALPSLAGQEVHWLKIDVEGLEEEVLRGWDSTLLRPWIIVIEATVPMSKEVRYDGSEQVLVDAGYKFEYFDGLNRFYIAQEHHELAGAFSAPPNVFDDAELSGFASAPWCRGVVTRDDETIATLRNQLAVAQERAARDDAAALAATREADATALARTREMESIFDRISSLADAQAQARTALADAEARAKWAEQHAAAAEHRLREVLNSTSWRATVPLRLAGAPFRRITSAYKEGRIASGTKRRFKAVLGMAAHAIIRHPTIKRGVVWCLDLAPPLRQRLRIALAPPPLPTAATRRPDLTPDDLSPDAQAIYRQLQAAIETHKS